EACADEKQSEDEEKERRRRPGAAAAHHLATLAHTDHCIGTPGLIPILCYTINYYFLGMYLTVPVF
ncbi:unnamed protein product, partial [Heligmosomoides polygyrus]|uniref:G_PROTEIN_RECEP_F1_2 domain-containing protein n=1 Tax=Heligmosomoides polygyrus TaxID=6339 RepID=A0A183GHP2_HELPZ